MPFGQSVYPKVRGTRSLCLRVALPALALRLNLV